MSVVENPSKRTFQWPADYYSSAAPKPVLPQWAPFGCGAAAVVVLILVFAAGALLSSTDFLTDFMGLAIGMSVSEMKGQYAADVSAAQKKSVNDEIQLMLKNLREKKISVPTMQPFLQRLREVTSDSKVTASEAASLQTVARKINSGAKR